MARFAYDKGHDMVMLGRDPLDLAKSYRAAGPRRLRSDDANPGEEDDRGR